MYHTSAEMSFSNSLWGQKLPEQLSNFFCSNNHFWTMPTGYGLHHPVLRVARIVSKASGGFLYTMSIYPNPLQVPDVRSHPYEPYHHRWYCLSLHRAATLSVCTSDCIQFIIVEILTIHGLWRDFLPPTRLRSVSGGPAPYGDAKRSLSYNSDLCIWTPH